jgi:hypothetical protein
VPVALWRCCGCSHNSWTDIDGDDCGTYVALKFCLPSGAYGEQWLVDGGDGDAVTFSDYANGGLSAHDACCACGGGRSVQLGTDGSAVEDVLDDRALSDQDGPTADTPPPTAVAATTGELPAPQCTDSPVGWVDSSGVSCRRYRELNICTAGKRPEGDARATLLRVLALGAVAGVDAGTACCVCGGGAVQPADLDPAAVGAGDEAEDLLNLVLRAPTCNGVADKPSCALADEQQAQLLCSVPPFSEDCKLRCELCDLPTAMPCDADPCLNGATCTNVAAAANDEDGADCDQCAALLSDVCSIGVDFGSPEQVQSFKDVIVATVGAAPADELPAECGTFLPCIPAIVQLCSGVPGSGVGSGVRNVLGLPSGDGGGGGGSNGDGDGGDAISMTFECACSPMYSGPTCADAVTLTSTTATTVTEPYSIPANTDTLLPAAVNVGGGNAFPGSSFVLADSKGSRASTTYIGTVTVGTVASAVRVQVGAAFQEVEVAPAATTAVRMTATVLTAESYHDSATVRVAVQVRDGRNTVPTADWTRIVVSD